MCTPTSVGINDDLSSGQTSISVRTSDDESSRWVQVQDGLISQHLGWNDLSDQLFKIRSDDFVSDTLFVLSGDGHSVYSLRSDETSFGVLSVDNGDLGLSIRSNPLVFT